MNFLVSWSRGGGGGGTLGCFSTGTPPSPEPGACPNPGFRSKDFSKDFCKRVVGGAGAQFSSGNTCRRSNNKGTSGAAYQLLGASVCLERTKPLTAMGSIPAEVRFLPEESPPGVFCVGASFVTLKLPRDDPSLAATARLAFAFTSCPSSEPESLSGISKKCPTSSPLFPGSSSGSLSSKTPTPNASPREV